MLRVKLQRSLAGVTMIGQLLGELILTSAANLVVLATSSMVNYVVKRWDDASRDAEKHVRP